MRTTVRLPDDLMQRARQLAERERRTLTDLIETGLRLVVDKKPVAKTAQPKPFPVSSSGGRCLVDLSDMSAVYDAMDEGVPWQKRR